MFNYIVVLITILEVSTSSALLQRLPETLNPVLYDLKLIFDTGDSPKYFGYVIIKLTCVKETQKIVLHANLEYGITIVNDDVTVIKLDETKEQINIENISYDSQNEFMNVNLKDDLVSQNEYILTIPFEGVINDKTKGLIIHESDGRYLIAANFKRTFARTVFPCFDEPALKAKFRLAIEHKVEEKIISNTPLSEHIESTDSPGWWVDTFFPTPPISTYQLSFVLYGVLMTDHSIVFSVNSIPVTFTIKEDLKQLAEPGSQLTAFGLDLLLEGYKLPTITPQVVKKIDYVVIPGAETVDTAALGLIVNSERQYFMSTSKDNSVPMMHLIYEGMAKQWFGVAVTPKWWDSEWILNCLAKYVPLFILPDEYIKQEILPLMFDVMDWDSLPGAEKVNNVLLKNGALETVDSDKKLTKGLMLLHMVHKTIGIAGFNQGVQQFARKYTSKSISVDDFWRVIDDYATYSKGYWRFKTNVEVIPKEIGTKQVMSSWTDQEGYPLVYVERSGTNVKISQSRFYSEKKSQKVQTEKNQCWWIPLTYTTEANPSGFQDTMPKHWLGCNKKYSSSILLKKVVKGNQWIIFNNKLSGLYRVNYDVKSWKNIIASLRDPKQFSKIHIFNRAQLVNDALALSFKKDLDFDTTFKLLSYLRYETDLFVWKSFFMGIMKLTEVLKRSPVMDDFKVFMRDAITKVYETEYPSKNTALRYIDEDTSPADSLTKLLISMWSCRFMVPKCIAHSKEIFSKWEKAEKIDEASMVFPRGLIMSVLCSEMISDQEDKHFKFVFDKFQALDKDDSSRQIYIEVLSCPRSSSAIKTLLDWSTSTSVNEVKEEKIAVLNNLIIEKYTFEQTQQYFFKNLEKIRKFFSSLDSSGGQGPIVNLLWNMAKEMNVAELDQLIRLIKKDNILKNSIRDEDMREWKKNAQDKKQWLNDNANLLKLALSGAKNG